mgnify:CR=1 FL=1
MTLSVNVFLTMDGVMQGPGGADEDRSGGFERGGWLVPHASPAITQIVSSWFSRADALLLGRNTYETMQPYWEPAVDPDDAVAHALNKLPKYVVSSTLSDPTWNNTRVLSGAPLAAIAGLREGRHELQLHGSHQLARSLHDTGLVDEYRLLVFPVVVGSGKRLFDTGAAPSGFELLESEALDNGVLHLRLRPVPFTTSEIGLGLL